MKHPTPDYLLLSLSEALQSLTGAGTAMILTCSIAGAIPAAAGYHDVPPSDEWLFLATAWIAHWAIAGIMVWGVLAAVIPTWCLYELLHGAKSISLVIGIAFGTQLIVSTAATLVMDGATEWHRVVVASGTGLGFLSACALLRAARRSR